ncbi:hypothetical protein ACH4U3_41850 [Streptomyces griseoruber]|uniref:hypothetical protein n=1 Tax=Streptomyces griseoruber TaxID=1943 RepID=UPI0037B02E85
MADFKSTSVDGMTQAGVDLADAHSRLADAEAKMENARSLLVAHWVAKAGSEFDVAMKDWIEKCGATKRDLESIMQKMQAGASLIAAGAEETEAIARSAALSGLPGV